MKAAITISHPSEVEHGDDGDGVEMVVSVEADDARPGDVLLGLGTPDEHLGGVYLSATAARGYAAALNHFADEVSA